MKTSVSALKWFFAALSAAMLLVTLKTSLQSNLFEVLPGMVRDPWTLATFIDFYFNVLLIFTWVAYKENNLWRSALWFCAFLALGSIATCAYAFWQLHRLKPGEGPQQALLSRRSAS